MDSADLAVFKADLYSAGVEGCAGEDVLDDPFSETPGPLVFFQDDCNRQSWMNVFSVLAVHLFPVGVLRFLKAKPAKTAFSALDKALIAASLFAAVLLVCPFSR